MVDPQLTAAMHGPVSMAFGWVAAIPWIISGVQALFAAKKAAGGGGSSSSGGGGGALDALLKQQQEESDRNSPLRRLLVGQQAALLPTYMQQDPNYRQWLANSSGAASTAMDGGGPENPLLAGRPYVGVAGQPGRRIYQSAGLSGYGAAPGLPPGMTAPPQGGYTRPGGGFGDYTQVP